VEPLKLTPTRRNNKVGEEGIYNKIDIFLIVENVMTRADKIRSWVGVGGCFDHLPIFLQL
jgi:hypothetical protein